MAVGVAVGVAVAVVSLLRFLGERDVVLSPLEVVAGGPSTIGLSCRVG